MNSNTKTVLTVRHPCVALFKLTISDLTFGLALLFASCSLCLAQADKRVAARSVSADFDIIETLLLVAVLVGRPEQRAEYDDE